METPVNTELMLTIIHAPLISNEAGINLCVQRGL